MDDTAPPLPVPAQEAARLAALDAAIRLIPDFPQPGIIFRDITPLLAAPALFASAVDLLAARARHHAPNVIVAVEARGFLFGAPLALALCIAMVPVRKPGKLPGDVHGVDYGLEYGRDRLEVHVDAVKPGMRALLVDDLLATGGTVSAAAELVRRSGGQVVGAAFLIALTALGGVARLEAEHVPVDALLHY